MIKVTKHAIKRYRERLFNYSFSEGEIKNTLLRIATMGKIICVKINDSGKCLEIKHNGISIIALKQEKDLIIITCLGEDKYRKWIRSKENAYHVNKTLFY